jgi:hypothetical protein
MMRFNEEVRKALAAGGKRSRSLKTMALCMAMDSGSGWPYLGTRLHGAWHDQASPEGDLEFLRVGPAAII